jgi:hypothetical protein
MPAPTSISQAVAYLYDLATHNGKNYTTPSQQLPVVNSSHTNSNHHQHPAQEDLDFVNSNAPLRASRRSSSSSSSKNSNNNSNKEKTPIEKEDENNNNQQQPSTSAKILENKNNNHNDDDDQQQKEERRLNLDEP